MTHRHALPRRRFLKLVGGAAVGSALAHDSWLTPGAVRAAARNSFPVSSGLARRVLERAGSRGADFTELYLEERISTQLRVVDGRVESVEQGVTSGAGVRAIDETRVGYAATDDFDDRALLRAAERAGAIAAHSDRSLSATVSDPGEVRRFVRYERDLDTVSAARRADLLLAADAVARASDRAVRQVVISYSDEMRRIAVINSEGVWVEDRLPLVYVRIDVTARNDAGTGSGSARHSTRLGAEQLDGDAIADTAREAARMAVAMCDARPAPSGDMPVVLASGGGVLFHEAVGHGLEADFFVRGSSIYLDRFGDKIGSSRVSLVDGGALDELRGSYNIDDEGTPALQTTLVHEGILRNIMTDRLSAQRLGRERTANGRRESYRVPPMPRMSNTFIEAGDDDIGEMVRGIKSGLFAGALGGGEVDPASGNFTFGLREGYLIEDGKVTAPVRGANLVGSGPDVLSAIDRVGPDLAFWVGTCGKGQWVPVSCGAPTLRISSITVGGPGDA